VIPDEVVERVRDAADIVQIIGEYVPLKRVGADYRGACPFHQGTHRNFSVSPSRNIYHCFVCQEGGDVFTFLRKRLGVDWPEAVRIVAAKVGIEIRESQSGREGPDPREPFWEVNATAAEYFRHMLWEDEKGAHARAYLEKRGMSKETAVRFELGYAPREMGALQQHMKALGFDETRLLAAGLLVRRDDSPIRQRFSDRLIFPIHDLSGHCVGFGGRVLGDGTPKYLNSAESPVFTKGKTLYGLQLARNAIRRERRAILVEGYFDLISVVVAGVDNVVATMGTALTQDQAALVARYAREVVLLYDGDAAGLRATFRAGDVLLAQGFNVLVAALPPGQDPDSFAAGAGRKGLDALLAGAMDVFERKLRLLEQKGWFRELTGRRRAVDRLLPTIRAASDPVTRDMYVTRAAEVSGVAKDVLLSEVAAYRPRTHASRAPSQASAEPALEPSQAPRSAASGEPGRGAAATKRVPGEAHERALLAVLLQAPARLDRVAERLGEEDFWVPAHRRIYAAMLAGGGEADAAYLEQNLGATEISVLNAIAEQGAALLDLNRTLQDAMERLEGREVETVRREIERKMPLASADEKNELLREKVNLRNKGGGSWSAVRSKQFEQRG
jgi:DNA primase